MNSTLFQGYELLGCIYGGLIIGIVYAAFGIFRFFAGKSRHAVFIYICDIMFCICAAIITVLTLYAVSDLKLRLFQFVGIFFGAVISAYALHAIFKA